MPSKPASKPLDSANKSKLSGWYSTILFFLVVTQSVNPVYTHGIFTHPEPIAKTDRVRSGVVMRL